jgi:hypothetical protein
MAATTDRAWFRRMREQSGALGFLSDFATITASSAATGCAASNLQRFRGATAGRVWRSTGDTDEWIQWDFGSSVSLNWICVEGVASKGLRDVGTAEATLTLLADDANPPTTSRGTLPQSAANGGWALDLDTFSARYARLRIQRAGGSSAWSYFQLARVALDSAQQFGVNFSRSFQEGSEDLTILTELMDGAVMPRYRHPRRVLSVQFPHIGVSAGDRALWNRFSGYGGEAESGFAPQAPLYFSPDPSGSLCGSTGEFAPRFCWVRAQGPLAGTAAAGTVFGSSLELVSIGR